MKILDLFPNPEILEDTVYWTNRVRFSRPAHVPGTIYSFTVAKLRGDSDPNRWACSCPDWVRRRTCKHVEFIEGVK